MTHDPALLRRVLDAAGGYLDSLAERPVWARAS